MELIDRQALLRKLFPYEVVDKKNCAINAYIEILLVVVKDE